MATINDLERAEITAQVDSLLSAAASNTLDSATLESASESLLASKASEVSVGQAQRAACARALITKPAIILADEPTSSLDQATRASFIKALFEIAVQEATTIIFVSHDETLKGMFERQVNLSLSRQK